jgi:hypothetical protein
MKKILFVGNMKSPFMKQDYELLKEDNEVTIFNLSVHTSYNIEIFKYWFTIFRGHETIKNIDVIWIWAALPHAIPFILLAKLFRKKVVVNIGGDENSYFTPWIIKNSTCGIVPSPTYKWQTLKKYPGVKGENLWMIPNWVESEICDEILPKKENFVITACCSPNSEKRKGIPIFEYVVLDQPYMSKVIRHVPREEYIELLKHAKVYCQLSKRESFGISLLEAMAYGCIPVVSNMEALPWVVGKSGYTIPYGDVENTRWAIKEALKSSDKDIEISRNRAKFFSKEKKKQMVGLLLEKWFYGK